MTYEEPLLVGEELERIGIQTSEVCNTQEAFDWQTRYECEDGVPYSAGIFL